MIVLVASACSDESDTIDGPASGAETRSGATQGVEVTPSPSTPDEVAGPDLGDPDELRGPLFPDPEDLDLGEVVVLRDRDGANKLYGNGTGIAFRTGDSAMVRLLIGSADDYLQFDIDVALSPGEATIEPGVVLPVVIIGADAVASEFTTIDGPTPNRSVVNWTSDGAINGALDFWAQDGRNPAPDHFQLTYNVELGAEGVTEWDCDFSGGPIVECRFIE